MAEIKKDKKKLEIKNKFEGESWRKNRASDCRWKILET